VYDAAMFGRSRQVGAHIAYVAAAADDAAVFTARAREAAEALGPRAIGPSKVFLLAPPDKPPELAGKYEGSGDWMWICQTAIFEVWFYFREEAMRHLRELAFDIYDWTQAHATSVLCRLARQGLDARATAELIAEALPDWRHEQVMRVCGDVAALAPRHPVLRAAYYKLGDAHLRGDPVDAFELIAASAGSDAAHARARYVPFLKGLMAGVGLEGRTAFDDGHVVATDDGAGVVAKSGRDYPQIADFHQIRAALLLRDLTPEDAEVAERIAAWAAGHPDEGIRRRLAGG
jgi:hypothetical protein